MSRSLDTGWIHAIRKWTLVSWLFLSIGITLGMWWAYVELGWGGYWAWDPVENASLLPWLTMTAFLHSVMIQEKRGMLKRWNLGLIVGTFLLSIFGTFITRSGVIASVHSFTQSNVGYFFLAFLVVCGILSFTLLYTRWSSLKAEVQLESVVSREAAFLFNNLLLVGMAFSVLWGTLFPILSELVRGSKITVGPPFFNRVNVPLGLLLLALTGIGPLIAWRKASTANLKRQFIGPVAAGVVTAVALLAAGVRGLYPVMALSLAGFVAGTIVQEFYRGVRARRRMHGESAPVAFGRLVARNRRRYGGYLVHVGVLIYFVAFSGMAFKREIEATLKPGDSATLTSPFGHTYTFTHVGVSQFEALNRVVSAATVQVAKDGKPQGLIDLREAAARGQLPTSHLRALHRSRDPQQSPGRCLHHLRRLGGRNRGGGVSLHDQSAGLVGVVRRFRAGVRRAGDDVAGRRCGDPRGPGRCCAAEPGRGGGADRVSDCSRRSFIGRLGAVALLPLQQAQGPLAGQGAVGTLRDPGAAGRARAPTEIADYDERIKVIEQRLACSCGCTLDVFTCRTTDFTCTYSPQLHREVVELDRAGKTAQEILDAFVAKYGEKALMAPEAGGLQPVRAISSPARPFWWRAERWSRSSPDAGWRWPTRRRPAWVAARVSPRCR